VTFERETSCQDFARRFDSFLDGEMDAHSLRAMALHASHCPACGRDVEDAETLQELILNAVEAEVERLDSSTLWAKIEARLEPSRAPLRMRLRGYFPQASWPRTVPLLALGGALAAVVVALLWPVVSAPRRSAPAAVAIADNHAQIERIESNRSHVAVWSEPSAHTTAIWVASYEPEGAP
jgi:anti-sigma factor RsiW